MNNANRSGRWGAIWVLGLALLGGCAETPTVGSRAEEEGIRTVENWVDQTLIPYLKENLPTKHWIADKPFIVLSMHGDDEQAEIDDLTAHIRKRITSALSTVPRVRLLWNPAQQRWAHHRSLSNVDCGRFGQPEFYLAVDAQKSRLGPEIEVDVRALDLRERRWVPGFGVSWRTGMTPGLAAALQRRQVDEHLRGLRPLPFDAADTDLVAAYLARNVSCLLQELGESGFRLYPYDYDSGVVGVGHAVFQQLDNYLSQLREVQIVEREAAASVVMKRELRVVRNGLAQLWVKLQRGNERISGLDTNVYMAVGNRSFLMTDPHRERLLGSVSLEEGQGGLVARFLSPDEALLGVRRVRNDARGGYTVDHPSGGYLHISPDADPRAEWHGIWTRRGDRVSVVMSPR